ncbi:PQQ-dependent sugar dehydrogenase [Rhizohabitans arisaemae]|uniref:PQQ-dependent sugar dehydrogenase n=1 Tax=Rhizohabitans arisaemae TaxID=2720610 RepID=UPI0024B1B864|nr:PQQ-dependent sugar dehydrogenase [Rhizohabitans arisaemae]
MSAKSKAGSRRHPRARGGVPQTPTVISTGWTAPWEIAWLPDGKSALVTERDTFNVFRVTRKGVKTQIGRIPHGVPGDGGMMGFALSPTWNGTTDQDVFFMHAADEGNRVARMSFDGTSLSGYTVLLKGIAKNRYHNGGRMRFGPDGYLYVATGDAMQTYLPPDLNSLNGKILRITKTGAPAPGNPFGTAVYSYGHRDPQGLAFDSAGRLWATELGNTRRDELNLILPGRDYGWPVCEGYCGKPGKENPKATWPVGTASPSGMTIVNDTVYIASLRGRRLWRIELNGTEIGDTSWFFPDMYGRLRAVAPVPGRQTLWFSTSNVDNGGAPSGSDRIIRTDLR